MAPVLAIVPKAELKAVLVALELALENGSPSGRVSVEHVVNVLRRLDAKPMVETALQMVEAPRADTARYDRLRAAEGVQEAGHA